jgi:hypothetical protein
MFGIGVIFKLIFITQEINRKFQLLVIEGR